jgi:alpha-1,3-rhamnosyl/mannosyltransferase
VRSRLPLNVLYPLWNVCGLPSAGSFDVVHATGFVVPPSPRAALVSTLHDDTLHAYPDLMPPMWRRLYQAGFRRALRRARMWCANSETTKQACVNRYGIDPDRVVVTPLAPVVTSAHARDDSILPRCRINKPYVLHVGTLSPRKNQAALVRAFAAAGLGPHQLVLAGHEGWQTGPLHQAIADARLGDRLVLTGAVTDDELASLYAGADAFAFPSVYEGFGLPLLEALAFGIPAVASTDDALLEVGGDAMVSVDVSDRRALADALQAVATDETLRARLRTAGPARASTFTWRRTADATVHAWRRAAG